jgi:predicted ester cyclase
MDAEKSTARRGTSELEKPTLAKPTMSELKSEIGQAIERLASGRTDQLRRIASPAYVLRAGVPEQQGGFDALEHRFSTYRRAFPNLEIRVEDQLAEGQGVVTRVSMSGTQTGPLFIFPPSGKSFTMTAFHWMRLSNEKIVEHWLVEPRQGMLQQLGFLPPPEDEFIPPPPAPDEWHYGPTGSLEQNKALIVRLMEEAWDGGDISVCEEIVAEDAVDHNPFPGEPWGQEGIVWMLKELHRSLDYNERVADIVAEGEKVVVRRELSLHHHDRYLGIPPTYRTAQMSIMAIFRIRENKIVERWGEMDILTLLVGLGVVPKAMLRGPLPIPVARIATAIQQRQIRKVLH